MRRITKIGSVLIALLVAVPALSYMDLFGGAEAAPEAPLLYSVQTPHPVRHVAYANGPVDPAAAPGAQRFVYAYVIDAPDGDLLFIREKVEDGTVFFQSGVDGAPRFDNVTGIAISHDGLSLVLGTHEGVVHYFTSNSRSYDTHVTYDTRSHVTDVAIDLSGRYSTAVTYHGDVYFFERDRLVATGLPYFHHNPLTPFGLLNPDGLPPGVLDPIPERVPVHNVTALDLTLRVYTDVDIGGLPSGPNDPAGLGVVATSADGQVFSFNVASFSPIRVTGVGAVPQAAAQPAAYRLTEGRCTEHTLQGVTFRMPCDSAALADLIDQLDGLSSGIATEILSTVSDTVRAQTVLDPVLGVLGREDSVRPVIALEATEGLAAQGAHLFVVALSDGEVHGFRSVFASGNGDPLEPMWTTKPTPGLTSLDLSNLFATNGRIVARMATGSDDGTVRLYRAEPVAPDLGDPLEPYRSHQTSGGSAIHAVGVSHGDGQGLGGAGDHVAALTADGRILLVHAVKTDGSGGPELVYTGLLPVAGLPTHADLSDGGSVLASTEDAGVALYGFLLAVDLVAPTSIGKMETWRAKAVATARDAAVIRYDWTIEPTNPDSTVLPVTLSGETVDHVFTEKGVYSVLLEVEDALGFIANDTTTVAVGVKPPIVRMALPSGTVKDVDVTIDLNGTRDQDPSPGAANDGIKSLTLDLGDGRKGIPVDLATKTIVVNWTKAGSYTVRATATDQDGLSASTQRSITISDDGGECVPSPCPPPPSSDIRLTGMTMARDSAHSVSWGGIATGSDGRYVIRGPTGSILFDSGATSPGALSSPIRNAVMTPDGSAFVAGLQNGSAMHVPLASPATPFFLKVTDEPLVHALVNDDGSEVLLATANGLLVRMEADLRREVARYDMETEITHVVADQHFVRIVVVDRTNTVQLFMGRDLAFGRDDHFVSGSNVRSIAITPDFGINGRGNLYLGRDDGRVQIVALTGDRMFPATPVDMDLRFPIGRLVAFPFDEQAHWKLAAASDSDSDRCVVEVTDPATQRPCGKLMLIDSRGPKKDNIPQLTRSTPLEGRAVSLEATPSARHFFVGLAGAEPRIHRYDTLWHLGPVLKMEHGLPRSGIVKMDMAASGTSHTLFADGRFYWLFGPPTADFRVGPHDDGGLPQWGERVTVRDNATFDSGLSLPGDGTITSWAWDLNGDGVTDSTEESPVYVYGREGTYTVRLTVFSTVTSTGESTQFDRWETKLAVWNPPPVAALKARAPGLTYSTDPITIDSGERVGFDATGSYDPDGRLWYYRFAFGNGVELSSEHPWMNYTYQVPGVYHARAIVADMDGFTDESDPIRIEVLNRAPTARLFGQQPARNETEWTYTQNVPVQFFGRSSSDPDGTVQAYEWQVVWTDGVANSTDSGTGEKFTYTFTRLAVDHTVRLRVQDNAGAWSAWTEKPVLVDDGIRLRQSYNDPDRHYINPTEDIEVTGFVHDFTTYPGTGAAVAGADILVTVWYDGPLGSDRTPKKVEEVWHTTAGDGTATHVVKKTDAGVAYSPGQYRVQMVALQEPSWDPAAKSMTGGPEWSDETETVFIVEPPN
ncbi:MAG: PKD domain-containing protein [Euryarchaeota archaeon]|nr:PKD domain-containing protein [Euryarchaeota archaeon]